MPKDWNRSNTFTQTTSL